MITGGSRGIGRELCEQLLAGGWKVFACATSEATSREIPASARAIVCDVGDEASVAAMFREIADETDRLDLVVNNAGVLGPRGPLEAVDIDTWRDVFRVNADGPFLVSKAALPFLRTSEGKLVNVSSSVGRTGRGGWGPYACSKHALEGLTDVLADELRDDGVVVLSVNPGGTATDMRAEAYPSEDPDTIPSAAEIARVILELAAVATLDESASKYNARDHL